MKALILILILTRFAFGYKNIYQRYGIFDTSTAEVLRRDRLSNFGTQTANGYFDPIWDLIDKKNVEKPPTTGYDYKYYYMNAYGANNFDSVCGGGPFKNPSGDTICWLDGDITKKYDEGKQYCQDLGYTGYAEFRTEEDDLALGTYIEWAKQTLSDDKMMPGKPKVPYGSHKYTYQYVNLGAQVDASLPKVGGYHVWFRWDSNGQLFNWNDHYPDNWKSSYGRGNYGTNINLIMYNPTGGKVNPYYNYPRYQTIFAMSMICMVNSTSAQFPAVEDWNTFNYVRKPCGNAPNPTNTKLPVSYLQYNSWTDDDYIITCNVESSKGLATKMENYLRMAALPQMKHARLTFHHVCGLHNNETGDPCQLRLLAKGNENSTELFNVPEESLFNNGSLEYATVWPWEDIKLPFIRYNTKLDLHSVFDPINGGVNLDNVQYYTRSKCIPRWSRMIGTQFVTYSFKNKIMQFPMDRSIFHDTGVRNTQYKTRFTKQYTAGVGHIEYCARLCLATPSCDMFELSSSTCKINVYESRKMGNLFETVEMSTTPEKSLYVLHCSTYGMNLLANVDPVSNSREPWIIDSNCDKVTLEEGSSETLVKTKFAVNGWYRFTNMLECKKEETFKMEQSVPLTDFPMHMDAEYISTVQPRGYFRYWYRANQGGNDEFDLEFSLSFLENDVEYHKFGESRKLKYSDADKEKEGNEEIHILPDLSTLQFDTLKVKIEYTPEKDSKKMQVGPAEVVFDTPYDFGCFEFKTEIPPADITETTDVMSPAWCITKCLQLDPVNVFAGIHAGDQCICGSEIPYQDLYLVPSENETVTCSSMCKGSDEYICGGPNAISIYGGKCSEGKVRFGDHCFAQGLEDTNIAEAADDCMNKGGFLWYPETIQEIKFVINEFPNANDTKKYLVGYKNFTQYLGTTMHDGTLLPGIPFLTTTKDGSAQDMTGTETDLMGEKCVVYKVDDEEMDIESTCPEDGNAICKFKMTQMLEPIGDTVEYLVRTSDRPEIIEDFDEAEGSIHFHLLPDAIVDKRFIDITFSNSILLTALKFEMMDDKALKDITLFVYEREIQYPEKYTHWGTYKVIHRDLPLVPGTPQLLKSTIHFEPKVADRIKILINEDEDTQEDIIAKLELLGLPNDKLYRSDPIFDVKPMESEFYNSEAESSSEAIEVYVQEYGFCPSGSIFISLWIALELKITNTYVTSITLTPTDTTGLPAMYIVMYNNPRRIYEATGQNSATPKDPTNVKVLPDKLGQSVEIELRCEKTGLQVYVDGEFAFGSTTFHPNAEARNLHKLYIYKNNYANMYSVTMKYLPPNGILDIMKVYNSGSKWTYPKGEVRPAIGGVQPTDSKAVMKGHFATIDIYENTQGHVAFMPLQASHHCYTTSQMGLQCRTKWAKISYEYTSGYGSITGSVGKIECRAGYNAIGVLCFITPVEQPLAHTKAAVACADKNGATLYSPYNQTQNAVMVALMKEWDVEDLWIDLKKVGNVWQSKGKTMNGFHTDWALGEPSNSAGADCVYLSKAHGYKMKTENCKVAKPFICMALRPDCPEGFNWLTTYKQGRSCIRNVPGADIDDLNGSGYAINIANKLCASIKTRLATPGTQADFEALKSSVASKYTPPGTFALGLMKIQGSEQAIAKVDSTSLVKHATNYSFISLGGTCSFYTSNPSAEFGQCSKLSHRKGYGACEYTECSTITGGVCRFPFKYKGRVYDTCVTIDDKGSNPGDPWCSTLTDELNNHIPGSEESCASNCPRMTNCPVGFWPMWDEPTCYQDSPSNTLHVVQSFAEAEQECAKQGGRIFSIRSEAALKHLKEVRTEFFIPPYIPYLPLSYVLLGMKYDTIDKKLTYVDGSEVDAKVVELLEWSPGPPSYPDNDDANATCVAWHMGTILNIPCFGDDLYYKGTPTESKLEPAATTKTLSYLCEAKPIKALDSNEICHFPFWYQGVKHTSCSYRSVPNFNPDGKPWCATEVTEDGTVVSGQWILCEDERQIIVDESGAGYRCPMPFVYDRIFYDSCTRQKHDGTPGREAFYWCPDPNYIVNGNEYNTSEPIGKCPEFLIPEDIGCNENYEPINDKTCVRISSFPETYEDAQAKCQSEGGFLLHDINQDIHDGLASLLMEKMTKVSRFQNVRELWLGADRDSDGWKWRDDPQFFTDFTQWEGGVVDIGCSLSAGCSANDGLTATPSIGSGGTEISVTWVAKDKDYSLPYICMSSCPRYYYYLPGIGKCVKVVHWETGKESTIGDAMLQCSIENARLAPVSSCDQMKLLMDELYLKFEKTNQTYFVGAFAFENGEESSYRNWEQNKIINSYGYGMWDLEPEGNTLCNLGTGDFLPADNKAQSFVALRIHEESRKELEITQYNQADYSAARKKAGYLCEKEDLWGCPDGYYMNLGYCYKLVRELKDYADAELACMQENAILAQPKTFTESEFLESMVSYDDDQVLPEGTSQAKKIYLGHRRRDLLDEDFFDIIEGHGPATGSNGDCIAMSVSVDGSHEGWKRLACNVPSFFLCQKNETLQSQFQPFLKAPVAIFPLTKALGPINVLDGEDDGSGHTEHNIAYDPLWVPTGQFGSPLFSSGLESYMSLDLSTLFGDNTRSLSILFWVRPRDFTADTLFDAKSGTNQLKVRTSAKTVRVNVWPGDAQTVHFGVLQNELIKDEWNFVALTFDGIANENYIYVNDGYGSNNATDDESNGRMKPYSLPNYEWIPKIFKQPFYLGQDADDTFGDQIVRSFRGSMSCLQFFDYALDPASIEMKKYCPDVPDDFQTPSPCPTDYEFYDDTCYKISAVPATFAEAEMVCLPDPTSPYERHLTCIEDPQHWQFLSKKVAYKTDNVANTFWAGLSDRARDGFFTNSFGQNISSDAPIFANPSALQSQDCGIAMVGTEGYLSTANCKDTYMYACSQKPNYAAPDYKCPNEFFPYRGQCILPNVQVLKYDDAMKECAKKGSILLPIKDIEMHAFVTQVADAAIGGDVWIGLRARTWSQFYDNDDTLLQPLQETITDDLSYSDGQPFDPEINYKMGARKFKDECYFFRRSEDFDLTGSSCTKEKGSFCLWQAYECPEGYHYVGQLSDGRTCHGTPATGVDTFEDNYCEDPDSDLLRTKWMPKTPFQLDLFRRKFLSNGGSTWTQAWMSGYGEWFFDNGTIEMYTELYTDMRRPEVGTWVPPETVLDVNFTTTGCLEISHTGLLNTRLSEECYEREQPPTCEYKGCMTITGQKCLFPFRYFNDTDPELTYKICSSLDVYRPWCPTKLDDNLNVLEWGDCLEDCPSEPVNSVCLEEPQFPMFSDGSDRSLNFTANYTRGIGVVTDELDYVAFTCPLGYVFEDTNNITHYAICLNWQFIYLFDHDKICVPVRCTEPPKFNYDDIRGERIWEEGTDEPIYEAIATYTCPEGYVFEIYQDTPNYTLNFGLIEDETAVINLTCAAYGEWEPAEIPTCIPVNCTDDPYIVENDAKGMFDWDGFNKSYNTVVRYFCDTPGWGYPSSGLNELYSICQADKSWNVTSVDECVLLPCPDQPPPKVEGGWAWYGLENTRYKCPNGYEFSPGQYPYWYSNCTLAKVWDPPEVEECVPRQCVTDPPDPYFGMDVIWPGKSRDLGSTISYACPFRTGTHEAELKFQYIHCKWDKDTDNMVWWPPFLDICNRSEAEELHYRYNLTVLHGKSEYTYKGPVISLVKSCNEIMNEGRCLVIREKVWDYMSYKLRITKH